MTELLYFTKFKQLISSYPPEVALKLFFDYGNQKEEELKEIFKDVIIVEVGKRV